MPSKSKKKNHFQPAADSAPSAVQERIAGIDLIKVCAMFFVVSLHFCLGAGFYALPMKELPVSVIAVFRMLSYECVPLFLLISGFLMNKAKPNAKHYIKLTPIIVNSILIAVITIAFKILIMHENQPMFSWILSAYHLQEPVYGWYVNMYIPLYLLMPFINAAYQGMQTKKAKFTMLAVLIFVANLAITVNRFPIIRQPDGKVPLNFTPNFFTALWPVTYYWIGMMIAEYRPHIKKRILLPILAVLLSGTVLIDRFTTDSGWDQGINFTNEDFPNVLIASIFFLLLYDVRIRNRIVCNILKAVASLSMTFYLLSFIGDYYYFYHFLDGTNTAAAFVQHYFKIIPLHFLLSILASFPVYYLGKFISKLIMKPMFRLAERSQAKSEAAQPKN